MAVTSIWKVEGRLARVLGYAENPAKTEGAPDEWERQGVGAAILYAADPGKTEEQRYVSGVNCLPETALAEMNATKRQYGKEGGIVTPDYAENAALDVAREVAGFDVVCYGHDHMKNCETVKGPDGKEVLCLAPSSMAVVVGEVDIDVETGREGNRVVSVKGK